MICMYILYDIILLIFPRRVGQKESAEQTLFTDRTIAVREYERGSPGKDTEH